jgi:hypothetical protein
VSWLLLATSSALAQQFAVLPRGHVPALPEPAHSVAALDADGDGDGDLDLFGARGLLVNRLRQLHAPLLLRPGYDWRIDAYARFASNGTTDVFVPWLSLTRTAIPVPGLGTLGIVPHAPLPALVVPQPAGVASATWPVPNTPTLVGLTLHVQAVQLSFPGGLRLSSVVSDTLVR